MQDKIGVREYLFGQILAGSAVTIAQEGPSRAGEVVTPLVFEVASDLVTRVMDWIAESEDWDEWANPQADAAAAGHSRTDEIEIGKP